MTEHGDWIIGLVREICMNDLILLSPKIFGGNLCKLVFKNLGSNSKIFVGRGSNVKNIHYLLPITLIRPLTKRVPSNDGHF